MVHSRRLQGFSYIVPYYFFVVDINVRHPYMLVLFTMSWSFLWKLTVSMVTAILWKFVLKSKLWNRMDTSFSRDMHDDSNEG